MISAECLSMPSAGSARTSTKSSTVFRMFGLVAAVGLLIVLAVALEGDPRRMAAPSIYQCLLG
jgi:hypothetical protein